MRPIEDPVIARQIEQVRRRFEEWRLRHPGAIKILAYDRQGFWVCQKRLSTGRFRYWPTATGKSKAVEAHELQLLLVGGNPATAQAAPAWRRLSLGA